MGYSEPNSAAKGSLMKKWIWQAPNWPVTTVSNRMAHDPRILKLATGGALLNHLLSGAALQEGQSLQAEQLVADIVASSAIEGVNLDIEDVRSSLRKALNLGAGHTARDIRTESAVALITAARDNVSAPLTLEWINTLHTILFPGEPGLFGREMVVGDLRRVDSPMQIVGGAIGKEKVFYEAPPGEQVPALMAEFVEWYNRTGPGGTEPLHGVLRAALAHAWFEQIHPYEDGNGRIGRALMDRALAQTPESGMGLVALSSAIYARRSDYMQKLEDLGACRIDSDEYLDWFLDMCEQAQQETAIAVRLIADKGHYIKEFEQRGAVNPRQEKAMRRLFDAGPKGFVGGMSADKYKNLTGCAKPTATRDLTELMEHGLLVRTGGGRSVRYQLPAVHRASEGRDARLPDGPGGYTPER